MSVRSSDPLAGQEPFERKRRAALAIIAMFGVALRLLAWPVAPDTYDGVGFVEAVTSFDPAQLRPHPPGYPLYVALARMVHLLGVAPMASVIAVSVLFGALLPVAGEAIVRRGVGGKRSALAAAALLAVAPGFVIAGAATLSDGPALTLTALAYAAALDARPRAALTTGLLVGAALGVRPSIALAALPALVMCGARAHRPLRALLACGLATTMAVLAWAIPTAMHLGLRAWWRVSTSHVEGHLLRWGEDEAAWIGEHGRAWTLGRAVGFQLIGIDAAVSAVIAIGLVVALLFAAVRIRSLRVLVPLVAMMPYAVTTAWLQPVAASPRHALPVTLALVIASACVLAEMRAPSSWRASMAWALLGPIAVGSALWARVHRRPPAAVAMLGWVASSSFPHPAVVGTRSSRFAAWGHGVRVVPGADAGDAVVFATREDVLPRPLVLTSEVDVRGVPPERLRPLASFSRPSPLDRRETTLSIVAFDLGVR